MEIFVDSVNFAVKFTLNVFVLSGMYPPKCLTRFGRILYSVYFFIFYMLINGTYVFVQAGDLVHVWGDISLMTAAFFMLLTNSCLSIKILYMVIKLKNVEKIVRESDRQLRGEDRSLGIEIIDSFNREGRYQLCLFFFLAYSTIMGFGLGAEKGQLPLRAWYPYDEMKTPAYQITYVHQVAALSIAACVNISIDNLVTSLVALCSCRLQLLALSLRTLMDGFYEDKTGLISYGDEEMVLSRLRMYVVEHQAVLESAAMIQACFSVPILAQFTVSMFIICVTAYQLAFEATTFIQTLSLVCYLAVMMFEVFVYCYHGNQLLLESEAVSRASYECPWYKCRARVSKALLTVMCRSQRAVRLTAAGMADLSLATFMAIIKASYTFFTVLQRVGDGNN